MSSGSINSVPDLPILFSEDLTTNRRCKRWRNGWSGQIGNLSLQQVHALKHTFATNRWLTVPDQEQLAESINLTPHQVLWWFRKQRYYHRRQKREKNVIQEWNHPNKDDSDPDGDDDESCAQSIAFAQPTTSYSPRKYMYRTSKYTQHRSPPNTLKKRFAASKHLSMSSREQLTESVDFTPKHVKISVGSQRFNSCKELQQLSIYETSGASQCIS
ncbi:unnamed protein product [Caenorhabditis nigoni]